MPFTPTPTMPKLYAELRGKGIHPRDIYQPTGLTSHTYRGREKAIAMLRSQAEATGGDTLAAHLYAENVHGLAGLAGSIIASGGITNHAARRIFDEAVAELDRLDPELASNLRDHLADAAPTSTTPTRSAPPLTIGHLKQSQTPGATILGYLAAHGLKACVPMMGRLAVYGTPAALNAAITNDAGEAIRSYWWAASEELKQRAAVRQTKLAATAQGPEKEKAFLRALAWDPDNLRAGAYFSTTETQMTLNEAKAKAGPTPYEDVPDGVSLVYFPN